ncbi:MAG: TolC family protein [Bacteroidetes bacterium]|nr:MAG: TolC family protein [Bacteroidota bacterium]
MMRYAFALLLATFLAGTISAQRDSVVVLPFEAYMDLVRNQHPVAIQARLSPQEGDAYLLKAKGGFDPKAYTALAQKYFDGKQYYSRLGAGLKVPTWFGLSVQAGYEQNGGVYLDPENTTPGPGLLYAGVSWSVGQGLFIDKRRAELRKAQAYREITRLEQQVMMNELLYAAGKAYWDWFMAYNALSVYENALQLATERLNAVKQGALLGDRPFIDTLEAGIQVQNRTLYVQQARLDFANATALLSVYLWDEGLVPLEPSDQTIPLRPTDLDNSAQVDPALRLQLDSLVRSHPEVQQYGYKLDQLTIDRRWKQEQLKPVLNLKYNALTEPVGNDLLAAYDVNNYTWGLEFNMPIFLRKERGDLRLADIKIRQTQLELVNKQAGLAYKTSSAFNTWLTTREQVALYTRTVQDYYGLLEGERQLFAIGESSLFMVNSRELGYINAQLKLIELQAKSQKAGLEIRFALGNLN